MKWISSWIMNMFQSHFSAWVHFSRISTFPIILLITDYDAKNKCKNILNWVKFILSNLVKSKKQQNFDYFDFYPFCTRYVQHTGMSELIPKFQFFSVFGCRLNLITSLSRLINVLFMMRRCLQTCKKKTNRTSPRTFPGSS